MSAQTVASHPFFDRHKPADVLPRANHTLFLMKSFAWYSRLLAAPVFLSLLDGAVTLAYQPAAYWNGDRSQLIEANPLVWLALRIHPLMLIPGFLGWYALFFLLMFGTPAWIGLRCHVLWVLAHLIAITGWLVRLHPHGTVLSVLLWVIAVPLAATLFRPFRSQWNGAARIAMPEAKAQ